MSPSILDCLFKSSLIASLPLIMLYVPSESTISVVWVLIQKNDKKIVAIILKENIIINGDWIEYLNYKKVIGDKKLTT